MKDEFVNAFVSAAEKVINAETRMDIKTGKVSLEQPTYTSRDITIMVGVMGKVQGTVLYGMEERTALELVSEILDIKVENYNRIVDSAIREMCNVITSLATIEIEKLGYDSVITPPTLITGSGVRISTFHLQRILIPLTTEKGEIDISAVLVDKYLAPNQLAI